MTILALSSLVMGSCGIEGEEPTSGFVEQDPAVEEVFVDAEEPAGAVCGGQVIAPEATPPNLLLVVDRSGSMDQSISETSNRRKIDDTKDALSRLVEQGDGSINFGFMHYPSNGTCGGGQITVGCSNDAVPEIQNRISALDPGGGTPTGPALEMALDYQPLHDESRMNFVVLLTDGKPTCPSGSGSDETVADKNAAVDAAAELHRNAIDTFVIGLGEDLNASSPDVLNEMARAGGRPRAGAVSYYQANSLSQLNSVLSDISAAVFGCTFTLNSTPENERYLWVMFDGRAVRRDSLHANGWDYNPDLNQITAYGAACGLLQAGSVAEIEVVMGCDPMQWDPPV
ncbi:MAG: vWA domain-containing protein [Myxococcota bacterium]